MVIMDAEAPPSRRGRRSLIALLILLLVLLPLYLWPLRAGLRGLPGTTALPGTWPDPRNVAALAQIPGNVWDALMGRADGPAPGAPAPGPRNLTMISQLEELTGGALDPSPLSDGPAVLARDMIAPLGGPSDQVDGSLDTPGQLLALRDGSGTGEPGTEFAPGGYPSPLGPGHGGGPGGGPHPPVFTFTPGDPGAPEPTPEPATLLLVGSNLALLGGAAWRCRHRSRELPTNR